MPSYVTAAFGLDRSWMLEGRCHPNACVSDLDGLAAIVRRDLWSMDRGDKLMVGGREVLGRELANLAELECRRCPVQWECVSYAIEGQLAFGTWALRQARRKVLAAMPDWAARVAAAKVEGRPVGELVPVTVRPVATV